MRLSSATVWQEKLRALTMQACEAAELGCWDQVEQCYLVRGEHLRDYPMPPALAADLSVFDREIAVRIANARSAVQSQLAETAKTRRNLQGLRSWQGLNESERLHMNQLA